MGLYYQTRFYPTMSDTSRFVVLANTVGIVDAEDKARGWVRAEDLLCVFPRQVSPTDLTTNSWIVEYVQTSLTDPPAEPIELLRLQVR